MYPPFSKQNKDVYGTKHGKLKSTPKYLNGYHSALLNVIHSDKIKIRRNEWYLEIKTFRVKILLIRILLEGSTVNFYLTKLMFKYPRSYHHSGSDSVLILII